MSTLTEALAFTSLTYIMQTRHKTKTGTDLPNPRQVYCQKNHYKCTKAMCVDITRGLHAKHTKVR